jgi:hypothetical protein
MSAKRPITRVHINVSLRRDTIDALRARAHEESRPVSQMADVLLRDGLGLENGDRPAKFEIEPAPEPAADLADALAEMGIQKDVGGDAWAP